LKKEIGKIMDLLKTCMEVFLKRAEEDIDIIIPGFTHLMHAQPVSLGHYWMAYFWKFQRDLKRLSAALEGADVSPLGAGALAGSTLPLDREYTRELLGFREVSKNSLDTVSDRDFILDLQYALSTFFIHTSRLSEDLILWNTQEFNYIQLPDEFCTGSSMMPNKKNPDALELIRGKTGGVVTGLFNLMMNLKGLPLTYNRDLQEDKKFVLENIATTKIVLEILPQLILKIQVQKENIQKHLSKGFLLATDVAEYLVLKGVPFRKTHEIVAGIVQYAEGKGLDFQDLSMEEWKGFSPHFEQDIVEILTPQKAVARRRTLGGTGKEPVLEQIKEGREVIK
jgi:argininosuccinate lyase